MHETWNIWYTCQRVKGIAGEDAIDSLTREIIHGMIVTGMEVS